MTGSQTDDTDDTARGIDPALARGLTQSRYTRRDAFRLGGAVAGGAWLSSFLAACGTSGTKAEQTDVQKFWAGKQQSGQVVFANWPLYIDTGPPHGRGHPSLELFTKDTGIKVGYREPITEMPSFYGKIQPVLAAGQNIGYDIIVMTTGIYVDKMLQQNFAIPLDHTQLPNFAKYADKVYQNPSFDPGNKFTIPWQSGITGVGWNPKYVKDDITSINDLFNPKYKGKVGMFADNEDLPNLALLGIGVEPEKSTQEDWKKAADKLKSQRGLVRKYFEQGYIESLSKGDIWISMAWSGDIFQANNSNPGLNLQYVVPKEGGLIWTDNMMIPIGAKHPVDALKLMNFVYRPDVAAMIALGAQYITPVAASKQVLEGQAAKAKPSTKKEILAVSESSLVYPSQDSLSRVHNYRVLTAEEEKKWNALFEPIYQG